MELGFRTGNAADCCMIYPNQYPLEAGNPYKELQMEMEHIPYIEPYGYGWHFPCWGIQPPYFFCPCGHSLARTVSTEGTGNAE